MNLDELRSVRRTERQKDSLQHLRDSFYEDVAAYVANLKSQRQDVADAADDPFSDPEVGRLTDEIETAEDIAEAIYERRVGKVVKLASFEAADMSTETDGLTAEERALFDDLVARIRDNRATVLDTLAGSPPTDAGADAGGDATPDPEPPTDRVDPEPSPPEADTPTDATPDPDDVLAEAMGGSPPTDADEAAVAEADPTGTPATEPGSDPSNGPSSDATGDADDATDTDRTTLRITQDVGEIFGVDEREYDLARDDVVTLPAANADPLLERDAAERLD